MRHLVVCCDGTWNTPEQEQGGVPTPTNVVRLHHALTKDENQLRYYHPGVGTDPGLIDRLRGGGLGVGLDSNIKSAYSWLATTYQPGDAICLFGFSRGAYTVRSLAGMFSTCGLASALADSTSAECWAEIDRLYDEVYRPARGRAGGPAPYPVVRIRFLGVWDTVGSLGIPDSLGMLNLFDVRSGTSSTTPGSTGSSTTPGTRWRWTRLAARSPRRCGPARRSRRMVTPASSRCGSPATIVTWGAVIRSPVYPCPGRPRRRPRREIPPVGGVPTSGVIDRMDARALPPGERK